MLTTKEKGDIGLTKIIAELTENHFNISIPIGEHLKYDCIAEKNGYMFRVQSKYTLEKNNKIDIKIASSWSDKNGNHVILRNKGDYDILACYCPQTKKCYFISDKDFINMNSIALRTNETKYEYTSKQIRYAKDYENCDRIINLGELAESGIAPDC